MCHVTVIQMSKKRMCLFIMILSVLVILQTMEICFNIIRYNDYVLSA